MADRSCWHDGARLHTPSSAAASRGLSNSLLTLPGPRAMAGSVAAAHTTLEMSGLPRLAHIRGSVSWGEKGLFSVLQKNGTLRGQGQTTTEQAILKYRACHGPALTSGCGWGSPHGLSSTPGTDSELLCSSCCVRAGAFSTSFRSLVCIKSSLISSE